MTGAVSRAAACGTRGPGRRRPEMDHVRWLETLSSEDTDAVGGKNSSLGEMIQNLDRAGVRVPGGFATTSEAYRAFLSANGLDDRIRELLDGLDPERRGARPRRRRDPRRVRQGRVPGRHRRGDPRGLRRALPPLRHRRRRRRGPLQRHRRGPARRELRRPAGHLPQHHRRRRPAAAPASDCYASLFTDRAISYRDRAGLRPPRRSRSRSACRRWSAPTRAAPGVMFTIDSETGFPDTIVINAAWGLGENVVGGEVDPGRVHGLQAVPGQGRA